MKRIIGKHPVNYGVTLDTVKAYVRVEHNLEDSLIESLVTASYNHICNSTRRDFVETQYTASVSGSENIFASYLPVQDVTTGSVSYDPSIISVTDYVGNVSWTVEKGNTETPVDVKTAQLMLVAHWYENRGTMAIGSMTPLAFAVDALISPYSISYI